MGLFSKSMIILLVALSTPLLYRQFASNDTIKFLSNYYSNYKVIDQFLRQSAEHLDRAKDYLPDKEQVNNLFGNVQSHVNNLIDASINKINNLKSVEEGEQDAESLDKKSKGTKQKENQQVKPAITHRMTRCPGEDGQVRLWSKDELAQFDGTSGNEVYLGFLGLIYNVTVNSQHYGPGAEYSAFAGRDATRAFVTGNFTHDLTDDIRDIDKNYYSHVESWASFYGSNYQALGRIEGAFFDSLGCGTQELARVYQIFNELAQGRLRQEEESKNLPECNSEWNSDLKKGRVWCSTKSGGVEREWVGVPRLMQTEEGSKKCVCVDLETMNPNQQDRLTVYANCNPSASECSLDQP